MFETSQECHILAMEIVGWSNTSEEDLNRSVAILAEVLIFCDSFEEARASGDLVLQPVHSGLLALFLNHQTAPVICAMELSEVLKELPSMSVRMAINSGLVRVAPGMAGETEAAGPGIDELVALVETAEAGEVLLSQSYAEALSGVEGWSGKIETDDGESETKYRVSPQRLVLLEADGRGSDHLLQVLDSALTADGHEINVEPQATKDLQWAKSLESTIRSADTVVAIISDFSAESEMLQYQLEIAIDERRKRGKPQILPVWLNETASPAGPLSALNRNLYHAIWQNTGDNERVVSEVRAALASGQSETDAESLEAEAGCDPKFYIQRAADKELDMALGRHESIVLIKGPRQTGKSSLMACGLKYARERGWRCATTDFRNLSSRQLESDSSCYRVVATTLANQIGFDFDFDEEWLEDQAPTRNMDGFIRELLSSSDEPLVWFIDEADRLFAAPYASDFYGLVRMWHNARATDPTGPWRQLTVVIGYATEAHLFIRDLNRSPFNVGMPVNLDMFSLENTADLNERHGRPIQSAGDIKSLHSLVGGQPFLTRRAFDILARGTMDVETLLSTADMDDGPFGDHLRRILVTVTQLPIVWDALVKSVGARGLDLSPLGASELAESEGIFRLISAGILVRKSGRVFELRYELYKRYFSRIAGGRLDA